MMIAATTVKVSFMQKRDELKSQVVFSFLVILFVFPLLLAGFLLNETQVKKLLSSRYHGELIPMFLPVSTLQLKNFDGKPLMLPPFDHQWLLIYLSDTPCEKYCKEHLADMQQLKKMLKDKGQRLALLWATTEKPTRQEWQIAADEFQVLVGKSSIAVSQSRIHHFYLANPSGHIILNYHADTPLAFLLEDMKQLL